MTSEHTITRVRSWLNFHRSKDEALRRCQLALEKTKSTNNSEIQIRDAPIKLLNSKLQVLTEHYNELSVNCQNLKDKWNVRERATIPTHEDNLTSVLAE